MSTPAVMKSRGRLLSIDNPYLVPMFITLILVSAHLSYGVLEGLDKTLLAIAVSIGLELLLGRVMLGRWIHPASAYISGISVGILLRTPAFWPFAVCSALSDCHAAPLKNARSKAKPMNAST